MIRRHPWLLTWLIVLLVVFLSVLLGVVISVVRPPGPPIAIVPTAETTVVLTPILDPMPQIAVPEPTRTGTTAPERLLVPVPSPTSLPEPTETPEPPTATPRPPTATAATQKG